MDITPQDNTTQPMSDDQDLAKALAGVLPDEETDVNAVENTSIDSSADALPGMQFEEAPVTLPGSEPTPAVTAAAIAPAETTTPATPPTPSATTPAPLPVLSGLEDIKSSALQELRPLIDRVDLPLEEKFDTYLMLIRSTDDATLIAPAHAAAQGIADEKRKAEALLDIIKEIDYLSRKEQPSA